MPDGEDGELVSVLMQDVGISHPWIVQESKLKDVVIDPEVGVLEGRSTRRSASNQPTNRRRPGRNDEAEEVEPPQLIKLKRFDFVVQFCWIPTTRQERIELAEARAEAARAAQEAAAQEALEDTDTGV